MVRRPQDPRPLAAVEVGAFLARVDPVQGVQVVPHLVAQAQQVAEFLEGLDRRPPARPGEGRAQDHRPGDAVPRRLADVGVDDLGLAQVRQRAITVQDVRAPRRRPSPAACPRPGDAPSPSSAPSSPDRPISLMPRAQSRSPATRARSAALFDPPHSPDRAESRRIASCRVGRSLLVSDSSIRSSCDQHERVEQLQARRRPPHRPRYRPVAIQTRHDPIRRQRQPRPQPLAPVQDQFRRPVVDRPDVRIGRVPPPRLIQKGREFPVDPLPVPRRRGPLDRLRLHGQFGLRHVRASVEGRPMIRVGASRAAVIVRRPVPGR